MNIRSSIGQALAAVVLALAIAACSEDTTTTVYDDDPIEGTTPDIDQEINSPSNDVEQGTEGGVNLDSGNIPGSEDEKAEDIAQRPEGVYNESLGEEDTVGDE